MNDHKTICQFTTPPKSTPPLYKFKTSFFGDLFDPKKKPPTKKMCDQHFWFASKQIKLSLLGSFHLLQFFFKYVIYEWSLCDYDYILDLVNFKKFFPLTLLSGWFAITTKILSLWNVCEFFEIPKSQYIRWWQSVSKWWVQFLHHLLEKNKNLMWVVDG